jgi:predicted CXXCH cytochrome family protein
VWLGAIAITIGATVTAAAAAGANRSAEAIMREGPGISNHPVNVVPSASISVPKDWPVAENGAITCRTCHTGFPSIGDRGDPNLRDFVHGETSPAEFCAQCHSLAGRDSAASAHWSALRVAHIKARGSGGSLSGQLLDVDSRRCLECHDGVNATDAVNATAWNRRAGRIGNITTNHPVGIAYPPRHKRDDYRPASSLPEGIQLPSNQVSCISCHDLYARDNHLLTVSMDGSRLCFSCHATK